MNKNTLLYLCGFVLLFFACEQDRSRLNPFDAELSQDDWAPTSLTIEILTDSDVQLSWQESEIEATGFKVERQDTTGGVFVEVGSSDTTIYTDTGLLTGNEYLYQVCAYAGDYKSSYATSDTIVTTFPAPYGITAVPQTDNKIELAWLDSTAYESGFIIQRKNISSDAFTVLDSTAENTYQDSTVTLDNEYVYKVGAYSEYNTSNYTDTASVKYWLDCLDVLGGDALADDCGVCVGGNADMDCAGDCFGDSALDDCGVCDGDNSPSTGTCDCEGTPNGTVVEDCAGECGGDAVVDEECGGCVAPEDACSEILGSWLLTYHWCSSSDGESTITFYDDLTAVSIHSSTSTNNWTFSYNITDIVSLSSGYCGEYKTFNYNVVMKSESGTVYYIMYNSQTGINAIMDSFNNDIGNYDGTATFER